MEMIFCPNCQRLAGYKRALGFGTFFAVLLTAGLWLLAIPFYPKRCITCGLTKSESLPRGRLIAPLSAIAGVAVFVYIALHFADRSPTSTSDSTPAYETSPHPPSEPLPSSPPSGEATPVVKPAPAKATIGQEFSVGYWSYTVNSVSWQNFVGSGYTVETPDAAFLVVNLSARNNDHTASTLPPFKLADSAGREYDESGKGAFMQGSFGPFKKLNPGVASRGYLVFDVPHGEYALKASGGFESGEQREVDLLVPVQPNSEPKASQAVEPTSASKTEGLASATTSQPLEFSKYKNEKFGFSIDHPQSYIPKESSQKPDGIALTSADGEEHLNILGRNNRGITLRQYMGMRSAINGQLLYREAGSDWFVIAWKDGESLRYLKMFVGKGSMNSFTLTFPANRRAEYDAVVSRTEKSFLPGDTSREW